MAELDLVPSEFRTRQKTQKLLRGLLAAAVLLLVGVGVAWALLTHLDRQAQADVAQLKLQATALERQQAQKIVVQERKSTVEAQLQALDKLHGRQHFGTLLRAIDAAYREGIWFDNLHFEIEAGQAAASPAQPSNVPPGMILVPNTPAPQLPEMGKWTRITGHALNHSLLADFMGVLGSQPGVADLRLVDTRLRSYTGIQVVDFTLNLQLNEKVAGS